MARATVTVKVTVTVGPMAMTDKFKPIFKIKPPQKKLKNKPLDYNGYVYVTIVIVLTLNCNCIETIFHNILCIIVI